MKLKRLPEDFQVDEIADVPLDGGTFSVYRLSKRSIGTPEAIAAIVDRWRIPRSRISYGGLKDRHAVTTQLVTIQHGPRKPLSQNTFELSYLGQTGEAFTSALMDGNRFQITMRDMQPDEVDRAMAAVDDVRRDGLPNYFDDQRFGSLSFSNEWIAKSWCLGDWERALWLALADGHPDDRSDEKHQKEILREKWGQWTDCKNSLDRSHRRSIVTYLADKEAAGKPVDFRGAFARIRVDLRGLYLSAYQSALWNRMLARVITETLAETSWQPVKLLSGPAAFFNRLEASERATLSELILPLPSARLASSGADVPPVVERAVKEEGLELRQLRVKYPRDSFFSKGVRTALITPGNLAARIETDDLYPGRQLIRLSFSLPKGSYATILVKRLTELA